MPKLSVKSGHARFHCPGCECSHVIPVEGPQAWGWNRDSEKPTITPSILVRGGKESGPTVCHSFITDGKIQFLADCTHALAGQTVELPEIE